jgi:hypothetical protein
MRSVSAFLALKLKGQHYGENLARLDLLLSSILHFAEPGLLEEFIIVVPADDASVVRRYVCHWPELSFRIVEEEDHFPAFASFRRPWQVRPWQRQQIIKLNAGSLTSSPFALVLDPDVLAVKRLRHDYLFPSGRGLIEPESRDVHRQWWLDSADLLDVDPGLSRPGMNVTPAVLSTVVLSETQRRLEEIHGRPWMEVLLTSYCDWTEYSLYLLTAEHADLLDREHTWAGTPEAPRHLHVNPDISVWDRASATRHNVERMFSAADPGMFGVVQSNTGFSAREVSSVVASHLPVRAAAGRYTGSSRDSVWIQERFRAVSRLAAQRAYRFRRRRANSGKRSPAPIREHDSSMAKSRSSRA